MSRVIDLFFITSSMAYQFFFTKIFLADVVKLQSVENNNYKKKKKNSCLLYHFHSSLSTHTHTHTHTSDFEDQILFLAKKKQTNNQSLYK